MQSVSRETSRKNIPKSSYLQLVLPIRIARRPSESHSEFPNKFTTSCWGEVLDYGRCRWRNSGTRSKGCAGAFTISPTSSMRSDLEFPRNRPPLADVHDPPGLEAHESRRRQPGRRRVQSYAEIAECR